jgi:hypothetical protein
MDTQQESEKVGNGAAATTTATTSTSPPDFFQADRAEALEFLVLHEREQRLNAEARGLLIARRELLTRLSAKYGFDVNGYSIDSETGIAKRSK